MELELSSDQRLFRSTTKSFLEKELPLERIRQLEGSDTGFDRDWWSRGAELGWTAMLVPEELGGGSVSGEGVRDLAIVAEELGHGVAPGALLATNIVLAGLVEAQAGASDHGEAIEALVSGESVASWAVYEPGDQWAPLQPALTAKASSGGYQLNGVKDRVELAEQADLLLVTATTEQGVAQFLVPVSTAGVTVEPQWSLDVARRFGVVRFDNVEVPVSALVASPGEDRVIERQLQIALVLQCAETCGGLERVFAFTTQWAFDRFSFGRPLASYQALKHRFADMRTWLEACQATTQAAVTAVQERREDAAELVSVAKSYVGDRSVQILQDCVQIHGGIGVTWEHDLHLYLRRATVNRSLFGTPEDHRRRLADIAAL
ncbi:acyl-CoA dehydrogenase family protein [Pseudonocardia kunmingensis]|uniref:Alkylation response protein AidB-like acyl-CoA dehydrogenase n=1 Tax=Pseudonocardia kunmingensis TaxID=630975 RepID=A0A543DPH3_9PSEU|nr:acyl-CoA dehydrogenase family protein [Pseudonocardia kunmingensis]TQM11218.1 alkylation response protein AidB-like acyl-CoA dehydrogenase [Pseudonocardia kunmingensis]